MSRTDATIQALRELILTGALAPGERLLEVMLVERLGVSRTPIRAALARLVNEGLVEELPSVGYVVRAFTLQDIEDALAVRGVIEGLAAQLASKRLTDVLELEPLKTCIVDCRQLLQDSTTQADALEQYFAINQRFHDALINAAQSFTVKQMMANIANIPFASPNAFFMSRLEPATVSEIILIANQQHQSIVEAIEERDGARAESLAREHARLQRPIKQAMMRLFGVALGDNRPVIQLLHDANIILNAESN